MLPFLHADSNDEHMLLGEGGRGVTFICRDTGMCHFLGYSGIWGCFFGLFSNFWVSFFGEIFFV